MTAFDIAPIARNADINAITRDNVQLLVNKIFTTLPQEQTDTGIVGLLKNNRDIPKDEYRLPREKPLPKAKVMTRWEKFAQEKGIQKKKRSRMVWDEITKDWVPRWGYKSVKQNAEKANIIMEVKDNAENIYE